MSEAKPKKLYCYTCIDCGRGFRGGKGSERCTACKEDHTRVACARNREAARIRARNTRLFHNDALRADVHILCLYNEEAQQLGKRKLYYGERSSLGKPEHP